jgi:hypothetical protein
MGNGKRAKEASHPHFPHLYELLWLDLTGRLKAALRHINISHDIYLESTVITKIMLLLHSYKKNRRSVR